VTSSFIEIETAPGNVYKWKPTKSRLIIFAFIGILFSQPLVFLYESVFFVSTKNASVEKLNDIEKSIIDRIYSYEADKKLAISQKRNLIALVNGEQNSAVINNDVRKALVIFNEAQGSFQDSFAKELESIGFSVQNLTDVNSENLNLALTQYASSIRPGDVSFIFFVGRYKIKQRKFFLLPSDSNSIIEDAVDLQTYISQFNKSKPLASLFIFNLINNDSSDFHLAANKLQAPSDSLLLVRHSSNEKKELDGFIKAVLEKLSSSEAINSSFSALAKDYINKSSNDNLLKLVGDPQQTIYLNKSKEIKLLSDQEILGLIPAKEIYCSKFVRAGKKYLISCLSSQINVLQDSINYWESVKQNKVKQIERLKQENSKNPSRLVNFFQTIEDNLLSSLFHTLIAIFIISGGFLLRDVGADSIDIYERFNFKRNRINVLMDFRTFRINAKNMRLYFMGAFEKSSIRDFPNPFRASKLDRIVINKAPNASDDFFDSLKIKLKSNLEQT
jgi:hypothetical protein